MNIRGNSKISRVKKNAGNGIKVKSLLAEAQRFKKSIGTKKESSLHRTLKFRYTGSGGKSEVETGGFIADGIRKDGEYIEVQTGSFGPLVKKVKEFASRGKVRIIHPIIIKKYIEVYDTDGKLVHKRKSPVNGTLWDLFNALIHAPRLAVSKGVTIEAALVDVTEKRIKDGKGSWRRRGISIHDKELAVFHESIVFAKKNDYLRFIPFKKGEEFTSLTYMQQTGVDKGTACKVLYVLNKIKAVERKGRKGNSWIYARR
ncbi:MAG: hypothetical protein FWC19_04795 [Treponema sp.]|nr:hypothetical protein [Treponema sp.]MCL2272107.1 hypothetical protein [Treponema sp.]